MGAPGLCQATFNCDANVTTERRKCFCASVILLLSRARSVRAHNTSGAHTRITSAAAALAVAGTTTTTITNDVDDDGDVGIHCVARCSASRQIHQQSSQYVYVRDTAVYVVMSYASMWMCISSALARAIHVYIRTFCVWPVYGTDVLASSSSSI